LQDRVAKLERELEEAQVDGVVTLPRSGNKCGLIPSRLAPVCLSGQRTLDRRHAGMAGMT